MTRVLVVAPAPVGATMGGTGIRALELARALGERLDVRLAAPGVAVPPVVAYHPQDPRDLVEPLAETDVVVASPGWPPVMRALRRSGKRVLFDLYVPEALETVGGFPDARAAVRSTMTAFARDRLLEALAFGDGFVCASERQRDLILGALLAEGHITPAAVDRDPSLRRLVDVVPFGLPATPPAAGPVPPLLDGEAVLWNGGLWPWLDYETPIRAVAELHARRPGVRLVFMGAAPQVPAQRAMAAARGLVSELRLEGVVLFNERWVPYEDRSDWLLSAACAISAHDDHLETRFAFRTRLLDCFWARLPVVCTAGDELAGEIERHKAGAVVPAGDPEATAAALEATLDRGKAAFRPGLDALAARFEWSRVAEPLVRMALAEPLPRRRTRPRLAQLARRGGFLAARRILNGAGQRDWPAL